MCYKRHMPGSRYFDHAATNSLRGGNTEHISLRVPADLLERLGKVGRDEKLSMSDTIRLVLERGLAASERKRR